MEATFTARELASATTWRSDLHPVVRDHAARVEQIRIERGSRSRTLQRVLAGVSVASFLSRDFGRRERHLRANPDRARWFERMYGAAVFRRSLAKYRVEDVSLLERTDYLDLSVLGEPHRPIGRGAPVITAKLAEPNTGLVVRRIQRYHPAIARVLDELGRVFDVELNANAYVSASAGTIFDEHWDTHDVLILQTAGTKRWRLRSNRVFAPLAHHRQLSTRRGQPREILLRPGSVLYMPRGLWHRGAGAASIHLSIGFADATVASKLTTAALEAVLRCCDDPSTRLTLDALAEGGRLPRALAAHFASALTRAVASAAREAL